MTHCRVTSEHYQHSVSYPNHMDPFDHFYSEKTPPTVKMNIARDHYNTEWTIDELLSKVLKEIHIFEAGQHSGHSH